jgi:hypothetical protein
MTITVTIQKLGTTAIADVDLLGLDQTKLERTGSTAQNGSSVTEYVLADGALDYKLAVIVRRSFAAQANNGYGETRYSITLTAELTIVDDVLLTTVIYPATATVSWAWPGQRISNVTELRQMLNNAFCLTFPSVAGGVISDAYLTSMAYDLTTIFG